MLHGNPHCTGAAIPLRARLELILLINQGAEMTHLTPQGNR
jgi:hypothetical protein